MPFKDQFIETLKVGICRTTFSNKAEFMAINIALADLLEYHRAELIGALVTDVFVDPKVFKDALARLRAEGRVESFEALLRRKKSGEIWTNISISTENDAEGRPQYLNLVVEDISRQKETEKDLVRSRELFKVVFDHTAAAITVTDREERIVAWNPFAEKLLEMNREDLFNKPVCELYPEREWRKMRKLNIKKKGVLSGIMTQVMLKDGSLLDVDASISILKDAQGEVIGSIGILRDISKQKKMQEMALQAKMEAEEANHSKSVFLAKMSHELRSPMNAVIGMLDLTLDTELNDEQRDNLKVSREAATNLLGLLNDILDLSKAEAGRITIEAIEISLREVVHSVCRGLQVLAAKKDIELRYDVAPDVPRLVMGDPVRLRQIIINLVNNSIKFTHKGFVAVGVKVLSRQDDKAELFFSVSDTGIGIPKDRIGSLFELFTQVDEKTSRRYGGTGLGLAICKKIVEMMDGRIWAESEEGKGSSFNFILKLPVRESQDAKTSGMAGDPAAGGGDIGRIKILLAEDNLVNQKIAVKILEKRGWEVVTALNGQEAIDLLSKTHFDVVLMDDLMPEMSGVEATALIRNEEKQTGLHVPIIAMTANAMAGDREKYIGCGMDDYVSKPIDREALYQAIINLVRKGKDA
ncbi:MAG: PAS domain S-box protein [Elusimicrobia bacterium]|nr:PAS domain S-box protein [Elusimicrobiota bacterium]